MCSIVITYLSIWLITSGSAQLIHTSSWSEPRTTSMQPAHVQFIDTAAAVLVATDRGQLARLDLTNRTWTTQGMLQVGVNSQPQISFHKDEVTNSTRMPAAGACFSLCLECCTVHEIHRCLCLLCCHDCERLLAGAECGSLDDNGALGCSSSAWCAMAYSPPMCIERCRDTASRNGSAVLLRDLYYCDYKGETPKKHRMKRLPLPGKQCVAALVATYRHTDSRTCRGTCSAPVGCDKSAW